MARYYARRKDETTAMRYLILAISHGYLNKEIIKNDINLLILRRRPDFQKILSNFKQIEQGNELLRIGEEANAKGSYDEVLKAYSEALIHFIASMGEDSLKTALCYNELGFAYHAKGEYERAMMYVRKSLAIFQKLLGEEHQDIATGYNNLGNSYQVKGEYDRAILYFRKALTMNLKILGENHPDVATNYSNLGGIYNEKDEHDLALMYYKKALAIDLKASGRESSGCRAMLQQPWQRVS